MAAGQFRRLTRSGIVGAAVSSAPTSGPAGLVSGEVDNA